MPHFYKTPKLLKSLFSVPIWSIPSAKNEIYLTFDDGPIPGLTAYILDVLKEFNAYATFFCVGDNIRKHTPILEKTIDQGHAIGNHTYNHLKGWLTKNNEYFTNIDKCSAEISKHLQTKHKPLFRPPYGQITSSQINSLNKDYCIIMWDILAYDFSLRHTAEKSLQKIIHYTRPGSIVVFHDNYKAESKLKFMLPQYLKHFTEKGFLFKKISIS